MRLLRPGDDVNRTAVRAGDCGGNMEAQSQPLLVRAGRRSTVRTAARSHTEEWAGLLVAPAPTVPKRPQHLFGPGPRGGGKGDPAGEKGKIGGGGAFSPAGPGQLYSALAVGLGGGPWGPAAGRRPAAPPAL